MIRLEQCPRIAGLLSFLGLASCSLPFQNTAWLPLSLSGNWRAPYSSHERKSRRKTVEKPNSRQSSGTKGEVLLVPERGQDATTHILTDLGPRSKPLRAGRLASIQSPGAVCRNEGCGAEIGSVHSSTAGLRLHDLRHHAVTELAESLASDQTIMAIAGHVSPRMLAQYSHVRLDAKRKALDALSGRGSGGSYGTNHGTKQADAPVPYLHLTETNGGDDGTRTRDLCRDRAAF
jgi:hypothetical protein